MAQKKSYINNLPFIQFLILDVDGVLTDGGVYYSNNGDEFKKFNILDGYGMLKLRRAGIPAAILTGRVSNIVERRAKDLGITEVHQNLDNKLEVYEMLKAKYSLRDHEIAYIGDDEFDLPVLQRVGFSAAPANAIDSVKKRVHYVCKKNGGDGAVREIIEIILKHKKQL
ncbi:MAG TPA: HAD hydrolase family protein [Bacteroidota bacterium]|nr:HAD hydrolase family protein [Bacteroidota bacterium]